MPILKISWINFDGFNFYPHYYQWKQGTWHMKRCITGKEVDQEIKELNKKIKQYEQYLKKHESKDIKKDLDKCYACLKDINEKTDFWYHLY